MEMRLLVVGLCVTVVVLGVVWIIAPRPETKTGYGTVPDKRPSKLRMTFSFTWKFGVISILCVLAVLMLRETVTFHSVRMIRENDQQNESDGAVRFIASRFATTLVVDAAVLQRGGLKFISFDLKPCAEEHVELAILIGDENDFERKLQVQSFRRPQCFSFSFRLNGPSSSLIVSPIPKPDDVSIVLQQEFDHLAIIFNYFGGALWLVAFALLYWLF